MGPAPTLEWSLNKRQVEEDLHEDFERRLHGEGPVKRRIMDMGITKGVEIYVRKVAPLGDPMELTVRNYELSVRKADAEMIEVV